MVTLVCGLPGSGKTTYVKNNMKDGLCYDLDYIAWALRLEGEHNDFHQEARLLANEFLYGFMTLAHKYTDDIWIIRTAPKEDELEFLKPNKIIIMKHQYDVSKRKDYSWVYVDEEEKIERLKCIKEYAQENKIDLKIIGENPPLLR